MGIKENARFEFLLESIEKNRFITEELNGIYKELAGIINNTYERSDMMHINAMCLDHFVDQKNKCRSKKSKSLLDFSYEKLFKIS